MTTDSKLRVEVSVRISDVTGCSGNGLQLVETFAIGAADFAAVAALMARFHDLMSEIKKHQGAR